MEVAVDRKHLVAKLADKPGDVSAIFSRFNVVDLDGDVTLPGAFDDGAETRLSAWGHNWGSLPVGKGVIHADNEKAVFDGSFFLNTTHGADTYNTVKGLGGLQEWSYGFDIVDAQNGQFNGENVRFLRKLRVHEVSPVMLGAGIGTGTASIKEAPDDLKPFANEHACRLRDPGDFQANSFRRMTRDHNGKQYSVIMGKLDGQDTMTDQAFRYPKDTWSAADARAHCNSHDGIGFEVAKGKDCDCLEPADLPFSEHLDLVVSEVTGLVTRAQERAGVRAKEGRRLSAATRQQLEETARLLSVLLSEPEPVPEPGVPSEQEKLRAMADELERWRTYYNLVPA